MEYTTIMGYDRLRHSKLYVEKYSRTAGILCTEQGLGGLTAPDHDVDTLVAIADMKMIRIKIIFKRILQKHKTRFF